MKCKEFKCLIIEERNGELDEKESRMLAVHLSQCEGCVTFKNEMHAIARILKTNRPPELSPLLDHKTREMCHEALPKMQPKKKSGKLASNWAGMPRGILVALILLVIFTLVLIFPVAGEFSLEDYLSAGEILTLMLILQNAVMLLLAPLLFRNYSQLKVKPFLGGMGGKKWLTG
ncbi:MAG: zf-HC2 domain-containing protein [Candidatus Aminicenantes bacterium]|nr:zf-HC2 domain-containing protein [Candidatus Aminicenantes bacterium]